MSDKNTAALLVIDVQVAFTQRDERGDRRNNPHAEQKIAKLLNTFRQRALPVIHIHHHSLEPQSLFRAELPGSAVQKFAQPEPSETIYVKHANSAFIGTTLQDDLHHRGIDTVVCCGATSNHCVETTTRMAGNLGFNTLFVQDATWAYDSTGPNGVVHTAQEILSMTMCNLHGEFAEVVCTDDLIKIIS